jgi:hypothetical protein
MVANSWLLIDFQKGVFTTAGVGGSAVLTSGKRSGDWDKLLELMVLLAEVK